MIEVTSLGGKKYYLNNELIYKIESLPDTTIVLLDGRSLVVKDEIEEIIKKIVRYKQEINSKY